MSLEREILTTTRCLACGYDQGHPWCPKCGSRMDNSKARTAKPIPWSPPARPTVAPGVTDDQLKLLLADPPRRHD